MKNTIIIISACLMLVACGKREEVIKLSAEGHQAANRCIDSNVNRMLEIARSGKKVSSLDQIKRFCYARETELEELRKWRNSRTGY